jgi:phage terminase large subunit
MSEVVEVDPGGGRPKVEVTRERVFIPAGVRDNPHLPPSYIAELMTAPEHMRRAFLDGDWDVTPGSFFGDLFDNRIHVVDDLGPVDIRIPSNWPLFWCGDWGPRSPACALLVCVDNDGMLIVLDELYAPGENPVKWARKVLAMLEKWNCLDSKGFSKIHGYIDPSCFKNDTSGGMMISEQLFEQGLMVYEGSNERKPGWTEIRRRLAERGGIGGKIPGLRIARRCTNLIRTLPNLTAPENESIGDMDDIDTKQEDHAADALRYGVMSRPAPRLAKDVAEEEIRRWERISMMQNRDTARNTTTGY